MVGDGVKSKLRILHTGIQAFNVVFSNAIDKADKSEQLKTRVANLIDTVTYSMFMYTNRGLFECDKLTFTSQVAFQVRHVYCALRPAAVFYRDVPDGKFALAKDEVSYNACYNACDKRQLHQMRRLMSFLV